MHWEYKKHNWKCIEKWGKENIIIKKKSIKGQNRKYKQVKRDMEIQRQEDSIEKRKDQGNSEQEKDYKKRKYQENPEPKKANKKKIWGKFWTKKKENRKRMHKKNKKCLNKIEKIYQQIR